ncbi:MAG: hypothetical protein ACRCSF_11240, partial [Mycobacteriaceae bacterium]
FLFAFWRDLLSNGFPSQGYGLDSEVSIRLLARPSIEPPPELTMLSCLWGFYSPFGETFYRTKQWKPQ